MFKFIHAADIHLDSPLRGLDRSEDAPTEEIRVATRQALQNLVDLAIERQVAFVLIAGDLYDGNWDDHNTGLFFIKQMTRLREADIPVIMIAGNHDAANKMTKVLRLPSNVELLSHVESATSQHAILKELSVAIHGQSFGKEAVTGNLAREYPVQIKGMFNIGLLHTSLSGAEGHDSYAPCTIEDLRQKEYDYWALGHVHHRDVKYEAPWIVYPGNIQGRHIRETGAKGCYVVTVNDNFETGLEFVPLDVFRFEILDISISEAKCADDVLDIFLTDLQRVMNLHSGISLAVRVQLTGRSAAHEELLTDTRHWTSQLRGVALDRGAGKVWLEQVKFHSMSRQDRTMDSILDGPVGELLTCFQQYRDQDSLLESLSAELSSLHNRLPDDLRRGSEALELNNPVQMRQWLNEVEAMLVTRLQQEVNA